MARHSKFSLKVPNYAKLLTAVVVGAGVFIGVVAVVTRLSITKIECRMLETAPCPEIVQQALTQAAPTRWLFFKHHVWASSVLAALPYRVTAAEKTFHRTLVVTIQPAPSQFQVEMGGGYWLVDGQGALLKTDHVAPGVSTILIPSSQAFLVESSPLTPELYHFWRRLTAAVATDHVQVEALVAVSPTVVVARLSSGQHAILDDTAPELQVRRLKTIVLQQEQLGLSEPIVEIDVRYKLPVLRTQATMTI